MKIVYLVNSRLPTDHAHGVQIMKTCEALVRAGADVVLVRAWRINKMHDDPFAFYKVNRNFRITTLPSIDISILRRFGFWVQMISFGVSTFFYLLFVRADIVYSRDEVPLYIASFANRKIVWESHSGRFNTVILRLLRRLRLLVVISKGGADFYAEKGIPLDRILVSPDAVSLEDFEHAQSKAASRARLGLPVQGKIALYIGKLDGWKGADTLCASSLYLPEDILVAVIGGEPHEISSLQKKYPKVRFLGWRSYAELADNQVAGDVLIIPNTAKDVISVRFTSPLKLFTYMASGVPIIASDLPSIREIIDDQLASFFRADDPKDLARSIQDVFANLPQAEEKAHRAREEAEKYTWSSRGKKIVAAL